ncbi:MAG: Na+/H+ antiporter NhaC family protein [Desulfobacterales bacterium]
MTSATSNPTGENGRTPSMFASLLVFGVMISLILLSVWLFPGEVEAGPLQISMTLATLLAVGVAYRYGFHGAVITEAITHSINAALGTIFILLAIGAVIGSLYLAGTVPAFVYYGVAILNPKIFYIAVFILCSILSILTGSSFTTIGAIGVAFVGLANLMGVSPAIAGGAAVSGAVIGDKIAKISDSFVLTTAVVGRVDADEHSRSVRRTAIPAWILSALLFILLGFTSSGAAASVDPAEVQNTISQAYHISLLAFLPIILIFILSALRLSGFITLMVSALAAVVIAAFTQPELIQSVAHDPSLPYGVSAIKVGIETFATGFHLESGIEQMDQLFSGGGTVSMLGTVWLILVAASFGAVVELTGMIQRLIAPVIHWAQKAASLIVATSLTSIGLNLLAADPYVSIVLTARMYRESYMQHRLKPVVLSTVIADSGSIISYIIPWNVHGAFVAGALGIGMAFAPYAFLSYLSPLVTIVLTFVYLNKETLFDDQDAQAVYGVEPEDADLPAPQLSA